MFDFGAFRRGYVQAEERQEAKRAKNAQLYNDFVRNNPDATLSDREKFANDLAGGSEYYRSILPTRETMKANVTRRQNEVAEAERQRKNRQMLDEINIMTKGADLLSPYYLSGNPDEGMSFLTEQFGGMITDQMAPYIKNVAKKKAQTEIDQIISQRIASWKLAGANEKDKEKLFEGFDPTMTSTHRLNADAITSEMQRIAKGNFAQELERAAETGDEAVFQSVIDKAQTMFPHLSEADRSSVVDVQRGVLGDRVEKKNKANDDLKIRAQQDAMNALLDPENQIASREDVTQFLKSRYAELGIEGDPNEEDVDKVTEAAQAFRVRNLDEEEERNINALKNENENPANRMLPSSGDAGKAVEDAIERIAGAAVGVGDSDDQKAKKAELQANLRKALNMAHDMYGINLGDPQMVSALATAIDLQRQTFGNMAQIDPTHIKAAVHTVMSSGSFGGNNLGALERTAYQKALAEYGITSLSELPSDKQGAFRSSFAAQRDKMYTEIFDAIDQSVTNLNDYEDKIKEEYSVILTEMTEMFDTESSLFKQNRKILNLSQEELLSDPTILDHYNNRTEQFQRIYEMDQQLARLEAMQKGYLAPANKGGFMTPETLAQVDRIKIELKKVQERRAILRREGAKLADTYNQIQERLQGSLSDAYDRNVGGKNTDELVDYVSTSIGLSLANMPPEQADLVIRQEAEKIHKSQLRRGQRNKSALPSIEEIEREIRIKLNLPVVDTSVPVKKRQRRRGE